MDLTGLSPRNLRILANGVSGGFEDDPPDIADHKAKAAAIVAEVDELAKAADARGGFNDAERDLVTEKIKAAREHTDAVKAWRLKRAKDNGLLGDIKDLAGDVGLIGDPKAHDPSGPATAPNGRRKTLGERFTEDDDVKAWLKRVAPTGQIPDSTKGINGPPVLFRGLKDIVTGGSPTSAGSLVTPEDLGLRDEGTFQRPLTIRDLVTVGTTDTDTVEYVRVTGYTNNAAPVPEASGTSVGDGTADVTGSKPESDLELERVSEPVKTIAHWIPATKRALSDASQIRTLIDNFLRYGLDEELEDQIVTGSGAGEDFEGILEVDGTQPQGWDTDILVTTRKAKTKVKTVGRATASAYVFNPEDNERIDLTKDDNGGFYFGGPATNGVNTLWGLPRVESEAVPAGTGIVADWRMAVLWDREQASIAVSDSHLDFFTRNLVAILAELRAAFGIFRPAAFVVIDLTE